MRRFWRARCAGQVSRQSGLLAGSGLSRLDRTDIRYPKSEIRIWGFGVGFSQCATPAPSCRLSGAPGPFRYVSFRFVSKSGANDQHSRSATESESEFESESESVSESNVIIRTIIRFDTIGSDQIKSKSRSPPPSRQPHTQSPKHEHDPRYHFTFEFRINVSCQSVLPSTGKNISLFS